MTFQKKWTGTRKKELPNRLRKNPVVSLRLNLYPTTLAYLNTKKNRKERSRFILKAIETKVFIETNKRLFLKQMMEEDYHLCRYLLRKIGDRRNKW